jgi:hypothetical protein
MGRPDRKTVEIDPSIQREEDSCNRIGVDDIVACGEIRFAALEIQFISLDLISPGIPDNVFSGTQYSCSPLAREENR